MRKSFVAGVLLLLGILALPGTASAQVPSGSYLQSCGNIRFDGRLLSAVCADAYGGRARTRIDVAGCRGGDIANANGQLVCGGGGGRRPPPGYVDDGYRDRGPPRGYDDGYRGGGFGGRLPGGSWRVTCRDASMQGPVLVAACETAGGRFQRTSADTRSCPRFGNRNGNLVCE